MSIHESYSSHPAIVHFASVTDLQASMKGYLYQGPIIFVSYGRSDGAQRKEMLSQKLWSEDAIFCSPH